ncbi:MAG: hypothetical protein R3Y35_14210 [Clostridia bacterium]
MARDIEVPQESSQTENINVEQLVEQLTSSPELLAKLSSLISQQAKTL